MTRSPQIVAARAAVSAARRRGLGAVALLAGASLLAPVRRAKAQSTPTAGWKPSQPIRIVIPYAPGGTSDIVARGMAPGLRERLGQNAVVENRPGGATQIGTQLVATSKPDGHTLLLVANTFTINPSLFSRLPYDSRKDLAPVTYAGVTPHTIVVHPSLPVDDLKGFIAYARKRPGQLSYGSVGNGTSFHLGTEELKKRSGTFLVHVPYNGMAPVLNDVIGGNIQVAFANTPNAVPLIRSGRLKALAVAHTTRVAQLPEVPTVAEQGFPGFTSNSGFMYLAAGGTPPAILDALNEALVAILQEPATRQMFTEQGIEVVGTSRARTRQFIDEEMAKYQELVRFSGAKVD